MAIMEYEAVKRDLRRSYDAKAEARANMDDAPWKRSERARFAAHLRGAAASRLLEIGAGHGVSGRHFADAGFAVTCVDLAPEMVARCRAAGLTAEVMDFRALAFDDGAFDAVFGMNTLLHVPGTELGAVLAEVERVLAPGGLFYWGQYGGRDAEGVWAEDRYEPKRFFSLMTVERIGAVAAERFDVHEVLVREPDYTGLEYHGLVLRRRCTGPVDDGGGDEVITGLEFRATGRQRPRRRPGNRSPEIEEE